MSTEVLATAGAVKIVITGEGANFSAVVADANRQLDKLGAQSKVAGGHMVTSVQAASGTIRLLEGDIQRNVRAVEKFITTIPGVGAALKAAFPVVGALALAGILARMGEEVDKFFKEMQEAPGKVREGFMAMTLSGETANDQLRKTNDELANQIAKLEGKPQNNLAIALDEARLHADSLQRSLDDAFRSVQKLLEENKTTVWQQLFGAPDSAEVSGNIENFYKIIRDAQREANNAIHAGDTAGAKHYQDLIAQYQQNAIAFANTQITQRTGRVLVGNGTQSAPYGGDQTKNISALRGLRDLMFQEQDRAQLELQNASLQGRKNALTAAGDGGAAELMKRLQKEFATLQSMNPMSEGQVASFWNKALPQFDPSSPEHQEILQRVAAAVEKIHETFQSAMKKAQAEVTKSAGGTVGPAGFTVSSGGTLGLFNSKDETLQAAITKAGEAAAAINAEWLATVDRIGLVTGRITPLKAAMDEQASHAEMYRLQIEELGKQLEALRASDALAATLGGDPALAAKELQVRTQIAELEGKARNQAMIDAQAQLSQTWTGMIDNVWDELIRKANDTTNQIHQIASRFIDGINSESAKAITGGHSDFSSVFRSASEGLAKTGLEKLEGSLLKGFGLGTKADGSAGNPLHVVIDSGGGGTGIPNSIAGLFGGKGANVAGPAGTDALIKGVGGGLLGMLNDSDALSSLFGGKLFGSGSFFGGLGHFAAGGPIPSNMPSIVGERGPEVFMPTTAGRIIPNHQLSGNSNQTVMHIDARGTDPALTRENFARALDATRRQAAAEGARAAIERSRRVPG